MKHKHGQIEVITGCMFAGKTEELIRRLTRAVIAKQKVAAFKPAVDSRYSPDHMRSHNGQGFEAIPVPNASCILSTLNSEITVVAVDEVQFFDIGIISVAESLANRGIRVIVSGLDTDFRGEPFGPMPHLLARAEEVTKLHAICTVCGEEATRTQRIVNGKPASYQDPIIMVGALELYEARCREHHEVHVREKLAL